MSISMYKKICVQIAYHYPFTAEDVYAIYNSLDSVDKTIRILDLSLAAAVDPFEMAGMVAGGKMKVEDLIEEIRHW